MVRVHGGHYYVLDNGREVDCVLRGRMKKERSESRLVAIGDEVLWAPAPRRARASSNKSSLAVVSFAHAAAGPAAPRLLSGLRAARAPVGAGHMANPDQVLVCSA